MEHAVWHFSAGREVLGGGEDRGGSGMAAALALCVLCPLPQAC